MSNPVPIIFTNGIRLVMKTSISDPPGILYLLISTCSSVRGSNLSFTLAAHFRVIPFFNRMVLSSVMGVAEGVGSVVEGPEENLLV